ncbi:MAG: major capsid protein [Deltaproteobacteria bacterium]|nr:major capsid protein [Deltaproteobacteria bacterium]
MSDKTTSVMLQAYEQDAEPTMFLSGMFQSPRGNFHNSEKVEIDIVRSEEDIAIAIQDLSVGARENSADVFTNKSMTPPIFKEAAAINSHNMLKRMPGANPFESVDFMSNAIAQGVKLGRKLQRKILRAIEVQASQVMTTGTVTLIDENGVGVYSIDYKPKTAHFPNASVAWDNTNATILADLESLANVVRGNGLSDPDMLVMGEGSYELFIKDTDVLARMDNRRILGNGIVPLTRLGNGGQFRGVIEIGNYKYDIWTYSGRYKHPQSGVSTKYMPDDKVVMRSSTGRMDATFGGIPRIAGADPRVPAALTSRISVPGQMLDLQMNSWITANGETMWVQAGTRPLLIPTAIDTFGCLDTLI